MPQKTSFDASFYIENALAIVKRDGNRLIRSDFTSQQDGAKPHTSGTTIELIQSMGFPLIGPEVQLKTKTFYNANELAQKIKESPQNRSKMRSIAFGLSFMR